MGFPGGSAGKESACNVGDQGWIPGLERFPGEGKGNPLQYCGLENSMDYIVHEVAKSQIYLVTFNQPIIITSAPLQINRCYILEAGDPCSIVDLKFLLL